MYKVGDWITLDRGIPRLNILSGKAGHIVSDCGGGYWELTFYSHTEHRQVGSVCWKDWFHLRTVIEAQKDCEIHEEEKVSAVS